MQLVAANLDAFTFVNILGCCVPHAVGQRLQFGQHRATLGCSLFRVKTACRFEQVIGPDQHIWVRATRPGLVGQCVKGGQTES